MAYNQSRIQRVRKLFDENLAAWASICVYVYIYIYIYNLHNGECASVFNALLKTRRVSAFAFLRGLNMPYIYIFFIYLYNFFFLGWNLIIGKSNLSHKNEGWSIQHSTVKSVKWFDDVHCFSTWAKREGIKYSHKIMMLK